MKELKISFGDYELTWKVLDHEAAAVWFKLMVHELLKDFNEYYFRFSGFHTDEQAQKKLLEKLQSHIDFINQDGRYFISEKAIRFDQDFANKIHHHFEILLGSFDMPAKYYKDSSIPLRKAVNGLNHSIHDLETLSRNKGFDGSEYELYVFSGMSAEIHNAYRTFIPGSFYKLYTLNHDFGDIVLHYSQIGKTWLEAFIDEDTDVHESGIRPQYALSGEFDILFGKQVPNEEYMERLKAFLLTKGKDINDPNLRLGHLPVAKLQNDESQFKIIKSEIAKRGQISKITALSDGKVLAERIFSPA